MLEWRVTCDVATHLGKSSLKLDAILSFMSPSLVTGMRSYLANRELNSYLGIEWHGLMYVLAKFN